MKETFRRFAQWSAKTAGSVGAFLAALAVVSAWAVTGPLFRFSDTWHLVINTGTTIVTFLMVFLIQNTQNRDSQAIHAKLDELVIHLKGADNAIVAAEDLTEAELEQLKHRYQRLARELDEAQAGRPSRSTPTNGARPKRGTGNRPGPGRTRKD